MQWFRRLSRDDAQGQAMVETAIVAPLFIFMMLGLLQLTLILQARSFVKYAAYRAARTGAMHNACRPKMEESALAALVPVIAIGDALLTSKNAGEYAISYAAVLARQRLPGLPIIQLTVCGPLLDWFGASDTYKNGNEVDFDDPRNLSPWPGAPASPNAIDNGKLLRGFERTKLKIQVKYFHKLIIPFANAIFFQSWLGMQISETVRLSGSYTGTNYVDRKASFDIGRRTRAESTALLRAAALSHRYYFPLYGAYAFRMQSNLFLNDADCRPPRRNECWHYADGSGAGAP